MKLTLESQIKFMKGYIEFLEDTQKAARKRIRKRQYGEFIEKNRAVLQSLQDLKQLKNTILDDELDSDEKMSLLNNKALEL